MKISVIIPTYNRAEMLLKAIESVLNQTTLANEIIVIDDGSTDETRKLFPIKGVDYYLINHCGFPGKVRNIGVSKSSNPFIAFLDSDDFWHSDKLTMQKEYFLDNPQCRILHTKEKWIMNGKFVSQKKRKYRKSGNIFNESLQGCILGPSTVLMEKKLFQEYKGFNEFIEVGEDYDLWLRITNNVNVHYLDQELITKIAGHDDQLSFKYGYIEPFKTEVLNNLILSGTFIGENKQQAIDSLLNKYEIIINGCLKRDKNNEAQIYIDKQDRFLELLNRG